MNKAFIVVGALIVLGIGTVVIAGGSSNDELAQVTQPSSQDVSQQETTELSPVEQPGSYVELASLEATAAADDTRIVFFKADWCITCNSLEKDIQENLGSIPADVVIARANYDTELDLRKKYDVRLQHTLVQIDAEGNLIKKWVLSPSLADIVSRIERT